MNALKRIFSSCALLAAVFSPAAAWAIQAPGDLTGGNGETDGACQSRLKVAPDAGSTFDAVMAFCPKLPSLQTSLNLAVQANPGQTSNDPLTPATNSFTSNESLSLAVGWGPTSSSRLDLMAGEKLGQTRNPLSLANSADHQIDTDERRVDVGLTLNPLDALKLRLTGSASQRSVSDLVVGQALALKAGSQFVTASEGAGIDLKWRVIDGFSLDAAGKMDTANVVWRGVAATTGGANLTYAYFEPSLTAALATPGRGQLDLSFERAVSPIDPGALASFGAATGRSASAVFGPNREWRYQLKFDQPLAGDAKFSTTLVQARLESSTELGPVGDDLQAPVSVIGGERSEFDVALTAPLAPLGLPSFTFKGSGSWRSSRLRDPFTGDPRPLSGETPEFGVVELVHSLPSKHAQWGLTGHFGGDQSLYQMSQVSTVDVADSLGGFVEYRPGAFALRLQVDGLYGGNRAYTDTYFVGPRADGSVDHVDHRSDGGQAVRLILNKPL